MNGENEPDRKIERQRAPPSELINFALEPRDQTQPGSLSLSLSRSVGRVGENPGDEVVQNLGPKKRMNPEIR